MSTSRLDPFRDYVFDQLAGLEHFAHRAMFGGYGLYFDGKMFGVIAGKLYFKTDEESRPAYLAAGMIAWDQSKSYYEVPPAVLAQPEALALWARRAATVQPAKSRKPKRG